jgi:hypothetical protein
MEIHFWKNPTNLWRPPGGRSEVNIMNFTSFVSLLFISGWLMNDTLQSVTINTPVQTNHVYHYSSVIHEAEHWQSTCGVDTYMTVWLDQSTKSNIKG